MSEALHPRESDLSPRNTELPRLFGENKIKAIIYWSGLHVIDPDINLLEAFRHYFAEAQKQSCGRCVPCRVGSQFIYNVLTRLQETGGTEEDLALLEKTAALIQQTSLCELGQSFPLPLLDALVNYRSAFLSAGDRQTGAEHMQTFISAPCKHACPAHVDIPEYVWRIKEGDFEGSLATIHEKTPLAGSLGRVCVHPCEANCRRNRLDQPVGVRPLKRFVSDYSLSRSLPKNQPAPAACYEEKVAVIGAGPAGLTAAYRLAIMGYPVTIFEALPLAGGMLAVGIPEYRLPQAALEMDIDLVRKSGVQFVMNSRLGRDFSLDDLRRQGYKAVFIATGLHESGKMKIDGEDAGYEGFIPGVEYLRRVNLHQPLNLGRKAAVIGGGNVAIDCVRTLLRLGVQEVNLIYRRSRAEMPANAHEIADAEAEGVNFHFLTNPTAIIADDGRVTGLRCVRMELGEPDASGRRRPVPIAGSEFVMEVDNVIPAIGQVANFGFASQTPLEITPRGTIKVDPQTLETSIKGVFAGGDVVLGARTVIEAVASANRAVRAIDAYLRTGQAETDGEDLMIDRLIEGLRIYDEHETVGAVAGRRRHNPCTLKVQERITGFDEVEFCYTNQQAVSEAERCLRCYRLGLVVYGD